MSLEHSPARATNVSGPGPEPVWAGGHGPERFVTEREAAAFLGLSVRTLQRWRTEPPATGPPLKFYKLGQKRVAYRLSDCSDFAEARAYGSTSEMDAD